MATGKSEITVTLPDSTTIKGTVERVRTMLKALGHDPNKFLNMSGYYYSNSRREYVEIAKMNTVYLRNAINKHYEEWLVSLKELTNSQVVRAIYDGPENLLPLIQELAKRKDE